MGYVFQQMFSKCSINHRLWLAAISQILNRGLYNVHVFDSKANSSGFCSWLFNCSGGEDLCIYVMSVLPLIALWDSCGYLLELASMKYNVFSPSFFTTNTLDCDPAPNITSIAAHNSRLLEREPAVNGSPCIDALTLCPL